MSKRKAIKPTDVISTSLRIREALRAKLALAAKENRITLNGEIARRLEESVKAEALRTIDDVANDLIKAWSRYCKQHTV
jgi:hypothetical protein